MQRFLTAILVSVFLLAGLCAASQAADKVVVVPLNTTKNAFKGDLYYNVSFADFTPNTDSNTFMRPWEIVILIPVGAKGYTINNSGPFSTLDAGIHLPNTAVISEMTLVAQHTDGSSESIFIFLYKRSLNDAAGRTLIEQVDSTSISGFGKASVAIADETVDNKNNYYYMSALISGNGSDLALYSVRIKYRLP